MSEPAVDPVIDAFTVEVPAHRDLKLRYYFLCGAILVATVYAALNVAIWMR